MSVETKPEYPKAIILEGKTHILGPYGRTIYRIDSAEEEVRIRAYHQKRVEETRVEEDNLFARGLIERRDKRKEKKRSKKR